MDSFFVEEGMATEGRETLWPFRMRVSISAIGSEMLMDSFTRFCLL
jgi:hypothetical protein